MLFVALETSSLRGGVALLADGECLEETRFAAGPDQGRELLPAVQSTLAKTGRTIRDLDGIAIGRGPGSYTGMRLAVTAGKTLAVALGRPIVTESSLRAMAVNALTEVPCGFFWGGASTASGPSPTCVATILDGRQTFLYGALFRLHPPAAGLGPATVQEAVEVLVDDRVGNAESLAADFRQAAGAEHVGLIGDGADLFLERLGPDSRFQRGPPEWDVPSARALGWLCAGPLTEARFVASEVHAIAPAYLRPTEAERKLAGT